MTVRDAPQVHQPVADRPPTPDEEKAAARARHDVDVATVRGHEDEMNEVGANVRGEGEIEPDPTD